MRGRKERGVSEKSACVCFVWTRVCIVFFRVELLKGCASENKGPCIGGGVERMMRQIVQTFKKRKTPIKSSIHPQKKSRTTPPPAAPSHSNYEPRAGRSEYNFLYCVNVRTYVWIRKMFILQKRRSCSVLYRYTRVHILTAKLWFFQKYLCVCVDCPKDRRSVLFEPRLRTVVFGW